MLRNTAGGGRESDFLEKSIKKMYGSMLLAYERVGGCRKSRKKREWPLTYSNSVCQC